MAEIQVDAAAMLLARTLFGESMQPENLARLAGLPDDMGGIVQVSAMRDSSLLLVVHSPLFRSMRRIYQDRIENLSFSLHARQQFVTTRSIQTQVQEASRWRVQFIHVPGPRAGSLVSLAVLGFQGSLPSGGTVQQFLPATTEELKEYLSPYSVPVSLSLAPGSISMQFWNEYVPPAIRGLPVPFSANIPADRSQRGVTKEGRRDPMLQANEGEDTYLDPEERLRAENFWRKRDTIWKNPDGQKYPMSVTNPLPNTGATSGQPARIPGEAMGGRNIFSQDAILDMDRNWCFFHRGDLDRDAFIESCLFTLASVAPPEMLPRFESGFALLPDSELVPFSALFLLVALDPGAESGDLEIPSSQAVVFAAGDLPAVQLGMWLDEQLVAFSSSSSFWSVGDLTFYVPESSDTAEFILAHQIQKEVRSSPIRRQPGGVWKSDAIDDTKAPVLATQIRQRVEMGSLRQADVRAIEHAFKELPLQDARKVYRLLIAGGREPKSAAQCGTLLAQSLRGLVISDGEKITLSERLDKDETSNRRLSGFLKLARQHAKPREDRRHCYLAARKELKEVLGFGSFNQSDGQKQMVVASLRHNLERAKEAAKEMAESLPPLHRHLKDMLFPEIPLPLHLHPEGNLSQGTLRSMDEARLFLCSLASLRPGEDGRLDIYVRPLSHGENRAWIEQRLDDAKYPRGDSAIYVPYRECTGTILHLLGHAIEDNVPGIRFACKQFLAATCKDDEAIDMGDITGGFSLRGEMGRKGDLDTCLPSPTCYAVGKRYPNNPSTEVLAIGLQLLWEDPISLARHPLYFKFICAILAGNFGRPA